MVDQESFYECSVACRVTLPVSRYWGSSVPESLPVRRHERLVFIPTIRLRPFRSRVPVPTSHSQVFPEHIVRAGHCGDIAIPTATWQGGPFTLCSKALTSLEADAVDVCPLVSATREPRGVVLSRELVIGIPYLMQICCSQTPVAARCRGLSRSGYIFRERPSGPSCHLLGASP